MQAIKFPVPNRSEYIPSPYEPDADGVLDIGYYKGSIIGAGPTSWNAGRWKSW